jgi:hypothetical protein
MINNTLFTKTVFQAASHYAKGFVDNESFNNFKDIKKPINKTNDLCSVILINIGYIFLVLYFWFIITALE